MGTCLGHVLLGWIVRVCVFVWVEWGGGGLKFLSLQKCCVASASQVSRTSNASPLPMRAEAQSGEKRRGKKEC